MTVIGAVTALFAATVGLAQNDIKRVIAYSTCSQLGYMFFAAGVGAYQAAMFHLFTHAFFKALLFLAAGSVITAMHHEQDMRAMGGLWRKLPLTYAVMLVGTLAITGVGLPGLDIGFAGFYSKDAIINAAYAADALGPGVGAFGFLIGVLAAGLTSFYSWRLIFMTFHGTPQWGAHVQTEPGETHDEPLEHDAHGPGGHDLDPREPSWSIRFPLVILAIGAAVAGDLFVEQFIGEGRAAFWRGAIFSRADATTCSTRSMTLPAWVVWAPLTVTAARLPGRRLHVPAARGPGRAHRRPARAALDLFLYNKWFFDELYDA